MILGIKKSSHIGKLATGVILAYLG